NEMAPLLRQYNVTMGGINALDSVATQYMNIASRQFSNLGNMPNVCVSLQPRFDVLLRMSQSQLTSYVGQTAAQRSTALQAPTQ
ncbi:MAG: hypothetical protein K2P92_07860, partial [Bdellovibrionaceae bacterium]|nr:hypothetical protein [Pseudobdellovibrionaceae bacterium]